MAAACDTVAEACPTVEPTAEVTAGGTVGWAAEVAEPLVDEAPVEAGLLAPDTT